MTFSLCQIGLKVFGGGLSFRFSFVMVGLLQAKRLRVQAGEGANYYQKDLQLTLLVMGGGAIMTTGFFRGVK